MGGQDKGLIEINQRPMVDYLVQSLRSQGVNIILNANRNLEKYKTYNLPVVSDEMDGFQGPLAGFFAAMKICSSEYILTLPCDGPLLSSNYVSRFIEQHNAKESVICVAEDAERLQPVHALIAVSLQDDLLQFLESGDRKIDRWYGQYEFTKVNFADEPELFLNANRPEDLALIHSKI